MPAIPVAVCWKPGRQKESLGWFATIPAPFKAAEALQVVNYAQLFGGEELSARSPVIQARMNEPELVLNPADAQRLALHGGSQVSFSWGGSHWQLPCVLVHS
ncbi:hypothetical protein ACF2JD_11555 [Aeromonas sp. A-5]|uniref:hypothetical protein n=1 Tax=Aeromonas ichthyocola TaxID=3367746 RepID=UPI0038D6CDEF